MATPSASRILPMQTAGTQHLIDRAYRETGPFQWVRETLINAIEAGATQIEYTIDWQAVENLGVYRRVIADNGKGMSADELVEFFNTFGGSGKPIGGPHENFGIGAKTSLLPWNKHGLVVISWREGIPSMIWVKFDEASGQYGLKLEEAVDPETSEEALDEVYAPYRDHHHGCDWSSMRPDWIGDNGTVIVLLGNDSTSNTILGDPGRSESDIKGIASYLNRRIWRVPEGVSVRVLEFHASDQARWPRSESDATASSSASTVMAQWRNIEGAEYYIQYPKEFAGGGLKDKGTVALQDGTEIDWFLWNGDRPRVGSYAAETGYLAALYKNELYNITTHNQTFRSFGIAESAVRQKVWLILRPPLLSEKEERHGVYPRQDRNALLLRGGPNAGQELPLADWGAEFSENMPDELVSAVRAARESRTGTVDDESWRERLAARFGARWRLAKLRLRPSGHLRMSAHELGGTPAKKIRVKREKQHGPGGGVGGRRGNRTIGSRPGELPAERVKVAGGIPHFRPVSQDAVEEGILAAWQPNDPDFPEGVVLINCEHPVLRAQIEHWQSQYPDHYADDIEKDVIAVYGEMAVAKVAHSAHLAGILPSKVIEEKLRSDEALTMSLLGLIAEEAVIAPRLGGKYKRAGGTQRKAATAT